MYVCSKRTSKIIVPPKEMLISFSIGTFLNIYDVTDRKPKYIYMKMNKTRDKLTNGDYCFVLGFFSVSVSVQRDSKIVKSFVIIDRIVFQDEILRLSFEILSFEK